MKKLIIILVITLGLTGTANAGNWTGNELIHYCSSKTGTHNYAMCLGFVRGAAEYHIAIQSADVLIMGDKGDPPIENKRICLPEGVELGQMIQIFLKKMRTIPEQTHKRAVILLAQTMNTTFPCESY